MLNNTNFILVKYFPKFDIYSYMKLSEYPAGDIEFAVGVWRIKHKYIPIERVLLHH